MIALVSGGSGFIGSHLVATLRARGVEVRTLARPLPPDEHLARDPLWHGVTHLFHLAARTRAPHAAAFHEANVRFTERLIAAATAQPVPPHLLFVSSLAAAGPSPAWGHPRRETDPPTPVEGYGRSKLAAERRLQALAAAAGERLPWTILRPPGVYGPRDRDFLTLFRQLQRPMHWRATPGWHAHTITHVHDVVSALLLAADQASTRGRVYHLGGDDVTWDGLYDAVAAALDTCTPKSSRRRVALPVPPPLLTMAGHAGGLWARLTGHVPLASPDKIILGRQPWWLSSGAALTADTGWHPTVSLADGLRDTARWYRTNGWL